jgi:type II secretory pathway pseudopilin PulG
MVSAPTTQRGVAYLALLLAVAITGAALAAGASIWSQAQRREREKQLLWAGDQIRKAIIAYSLTGGDAANRYPAELRDLLLDPRSPAPRRHLRRVYDDPMMRGADWGLIRNPQGRIVGVYSQYKGTPVKTGAFPKAYVHFERAASYADWTFTAVPAGAAASAPAQRPERATVPSPERAASAPPPLIDKSRSEPAAAVPANPETGPAPVQPVVEETPPAPSVDPPDETD